ncbi:MAG: hypothetical protein ACU833_02305 [Gammaproteobacteria bacterium]
MNILNTSSPFYFIKISSIAFFVIVLASCSGDEREAQKAPQQPENKSSTQSPVKPELEKAGHNSTVKSVFDHPHSDATDLQKHAFEHKFAEKCIERETATSVNKEIDKQRFAEPCMCISKYILNGLTAVEAEKFLAEQKDTQSLIIRYNNAAYHCLVQNKKQPQSPKLFGKN